MEHLINILKIALIISFIFSNAKAKYIDFSILELTSIAQKIYQNECAGKLKYLVHWNENETFASVGIGHFIWYPKGIEQKFEESFPKLLSFMAHKGLSIPKWLKENSHNPWETKEQMLKDPRADELREFLQQSISIQTLFLANRINKALPKILNATNPNRHDKITKMFDLVTNEKDGYYLLIDYVNFKGEGIKLSERYNNQGWGLLQVLECMSETTNPKKEFARCAKKTLQQRVENSPKKNNEKRWLKGWFKRIDTYTNP